MGRARRKYRRFGAPHRDYQRHQRELEHLFIEEFQDVADPSKCTDLGTIGHYTGIPSTTLHRWYARWRSDPDYRPWTRCNHGSGCRVFTVPEEQAIREHIIENHLMQGKIFTNAEFRELAMNAFQMKYRESEKIPPFNCSDGFIAQFKYRNDFRSRQTHYKRRTKCDPGIVERWLNDTRQLLATAPDLERIVNCDETSWKVYPDHLVTWAVRGADHVPIAVGGNLKAAFTALCSITAARTKLPMVMIASGKTDRAERSQLGEIHPHIPMHTESGWTTVSSFEDYLRFLRAQLPGPGPIHLILDCYSVHRGHQIRDFAEELGITLLFIPAGMTDSLQPLDRAVFGAMKATARRLYRVYGSQIVAPRLTTKIAAQFLSRAWEQVGSHVLDLAWEIYELAD